MRHCKTQQVPFSALSALVITLAFALQSSALAADDYAYKLRGNRHEGVKDRPISGYNVELLSATVDFFEEPVDPQGLLRIRFYLPEDGAVYLVVREIDRKHNYWLDSVQPDRWKKGFGNEFKWPLSDVIRPMGIRKPELAVVARIDERFPTNPEAVAPAIFYQNRLPNTIEAYIFTLKTGARSKVTCKIYKDGDTKEYASSEFPQQDGGQPFTFKWDASRAVEGRYRLVITGIVLNTSAPLQPIVRFYHQPKISE